MRGLNRFILLCLLALPTFAQTPAAGATPGLVILAYHDVRDDVAATDHDPDATSTDHFVAQLDWLKANDYHVVSLEQVLQAQRGHGVLPPHAVLLTFDDGLESLYTRVFPLLRAYHYPAVAALVGSWMDMPDGKHLNYNGTDCARSCFVSWDQVREMQQSGLVEFGSHTWAMHEGIDGNPQGNQMPSVVTLRYADRRYEDIDSYTVRITADLKHSADELFQETGKHPRVIAWPYGAYNQVARQAAEKLGMTVSLSLGDNLPTLDPGKTLPRLLLGGNIGPNRLAWQLRHQARRDPVRAVQVDLDYVYDADPAQEERNLSHLLDRIKRLQPSEVWLQAYADPKGDGTADAVYFPNRHLPMRADLFSRVAWQLRTRAGVRVYAWMPVLAFNFATQPDLPSLGGPAKPGGDHFRLAPYDAHVRSLIGDMYEDLAMHADEAGVLFSDDAYLRDTDMLGPWAALSPAARTQKLIDFTKELAQRMRVWRPTLRTARNIYTRPITDGAAEAWFAQSLPAFLAAYDTTAIMAMPQLDKQPDSDAWYAALVAKVAATPGGLDGSLFELATRDWNTGKHVPDADLASRFRQLQAAGVRHLGYYPDDFVTDHPDIEAIRPAISTADYPYPAR